MKPLIQEIHTLQIAIGEMGVEIQLLKKRLHQLEKRFP